jgi:hypothetical protein
MKDRSYPNSPFICLVVCSFFVIGCLGGKSDTSVQMQATPVENPPTIMELQLSSSKPIYAIDEAIPLEMTTQVGKFDLLVPYAAVEGKGAFTNLVVKNEMDEIVKPKHPIALADEPKTLMRNGNHVSCIRGVDLKAGTVREALLENLNTYYKLEPGDYTLQVLMNLNVYRESLRDQSPQILEYEREVAAIQKSPKLPASEKQQAVAQLREEIEFMRSKMEDKLNKIYLPLNSLRGTAELESSVTSLKIQ